MLFRIIVKILMLPVWMLISMLYLLGRLFTGIVGTIFRLVGILAIVTGFLCLAFGLYERAQIVPLLIQGCVMYGLPYLLAALLSVLMIARFTLQEIILG